MIASTTVPTLIAIDRGLFGVAPAEAVAGPELTAPVLSALRLLARIHPTPARVSQATQAGELGRPTTINRRAADRLCELGFAAMLRQAEDPSSWIQITPSGKREMARHLEPGDVWHILRSWLGFAIHAYGRVPWEMPLDETCEILGVTDDQLLEAFETGVLPL